MADFEAIPPSNRLDHSSESVHAEQWGLQYGFFPAYLETRFTVDSPPVKWPDRFAIITAWATTGEAWSTEKNLEADARLMKSLLERKVWHHRITGTSPDGQHAEPGWAVMIDLGSAVLLGKAFHQDAIYWVDRNELSVRSCRDDRHAPVGKFTDKI